MTGMPSELSYDQQALRWIAELQTGTEQTRSEFGLWIRRSPEHLRAYLRHIALATELRSLDLGKIDLPSLIERATSARTIVAWPGGSRGMARASHASTRAMLMVRNRRWILAAAILLPALVVSTIWYPGIRGFFQTTQYRTAIGQTRTIVLPDQSTVVLNTDTVIRTNVSSSVREVYLLRGEALFKVVHDSAVPFRVHAGSTLVEDLGTEFAVRCRPDDTLVSVVSGLVQVSQDHSHSQASPAVPAPVLLTTPEFEPIRKPARVSAGEQVSIVASGTLIQRRQINVSQAIAWQKGRLSFDNATLEEVTSEFNRYNVRKIQIHGDALRSRRYSGVFDAHDPGSFVDYLREDPRIEVEDGQDMMILKRH
jgi:transmembrane sensor